MERLSAVEKGRIIQMNSDGKSTNTIMLELGICRSTTNRFMSNFFTRKTLENIEPTRRKEKNNNDRG